MTKTRKTIQNAIEKMAEWTNLWGFKISQQKIVCVLFYKDTQASEKMTTLTINIAPLKMEKRAKFLGVIFDNALTFGDHVKYVEDKCKNRLNLMRMTPRAGWIQINKHY